MSRGSRWVCLHFRVTVESWVYCHFHPSVCISQGAAFRGPASPTSPPTSQQRTVLWGLQAPRAQVQQCRSGSGVNTTLRLFLLVGTYSGFQQLC